MSILGYSSSYFLPEYWSGTPLYGEKIIPLIDYILSTDFVDSDKLAGAFYNITNKYKNPEDLPIEQIKDIIRESGYDYVLDLLGEDEESIRLLTYLLVLIHQFKGSKKGLELVLNMLKKGGESMKMVTVGTPTITSSNEVTDFSEDDYIVYQGFNADNNPFTLNFQIRTGDLLEEQCISSSNAYGYYLGVLSNGKLILCLGNTRTSWNIADRVLSLNTLNANTSYYIRLSFDGLAYEVSVSMDGKKFSNFISIETNSSIDIHRGSVYLGVDASSGEPSKPFKGYINIGPFSVDVENILIEEWFEGEEVGEEDTFSVKADLDISILGTDFFKNFANFTRKYVYPSLAAFEAKMSLENKLTFLPHIREKVTYIAAVNLLTFVQFTTKVAEEGDPYTPKVFFNSDAFTEVGSPTISDDGIASNFSNLYKIQTTQFNPGERSWEITFAFNISESINAQRTILSQFQNNIFVWAQNNNFFVRVHSGSWDTGDALTYNKTGLSLSTNYKAEVGFTQTGYYVRLINLDTNTVVDTYSNTRTDVIYDGGTNKVTLGNHNTNNNLPFTGGSIDLKQFSITVDGVEVFSGSTPHWEDFYTVNEDDVSTPYAFQVLE